MQIEFVRDRASQAPFNPRDAVAMRIHEKALRQYSISLYPGTGTSDGIAGDHVLLAPAYNISDDDVRLIVKLTVEVVEDFFNELTASI